MKKTLMILISVLLLICSISLGQGSKNKKEICITFDDLPVVRVHDHIERMMITDEILFTLEEFKVKAAGFVVGDNIAGHYDLLEKWLEGGHILGNHTYSHPDLNEVPHELFIENIDKGHIAIEEILKKYMQKNRYFRYPYLHYGKSPEVKKAVADYLFNQEYWVAHVSIDTDDFAFNLQYEKIHNKSDSAAISRLGNEYFDHIMEQVEKAEKIALDILGRPVRHILLLHANRIHSYFLYDMLSELKSMGYSFISMERAFSDPLYSMRESYIGPQGISYLERLSRNDPDMLPAKE